MDSSLSFMFFVITLPAPVNMLFPISTGATIVVFEPIKESLPIFVLNFE
jgi:hypothetical protein